MLSLVSLSTQTDSIANTEDSTPLVALIFFFNKNHMNHKSEKKIIMGSKQGILPNN
jgi:hypothetical protein